VRKSRKSFLVICSPFLPNERVNRYQTFVKLYCWCLYDTLVMSQRNCSEPIRIGCMCRDKVGHHKLYEFCAKQFWRQYGWVECMLNYIGSTGVSCYTYQVFAYGNYFWLVHASDTVVVICPLRVGTDCTVVVTLDC
jgi:hypothetical protein